MPSPAFSTSYTRGKLVSTEQLHTQHFITLPFSVLEKKSQIQEEFMKLCKTLRYSLILKWKFYSPFQAESVHYKNTEDKRAIGG